MNIYFSIEIPLSNLTSARIQY